MRLDRKLACAPLLIGSLPFKDHKTATKMVMKYTPEIPLWVQLPSYEEEGMLTQFSKGIPSLQNRNKRMYINTSKPSYEKEILGFMEDYLEVNKNPHLLFNSRFALKEKYGRGMRALLNELELSAQNPKILKGQVTGPFTFCCGVKDQDSRLGVFDEVFRDIVKKYVGMNACWQIAKLRAKNRDAIIFIDEPILANFGSASLMGIDSKHLITNLEKIIDTIHGVGGFAGIHICGNTDWSIILNLGIDIVSFDAFNYFECFIMYRKEIKNFLRNEGILALGMVPTLREDQIEKINAKLILEKVLLVVKQLTDLGFDSDEVLSQSIITPTCGTGLLKISNAEKVLYLTREVSRSIRKEMDWIT